MAQNEECLQGGMHAWLGSDPVLQSKPLKIKTSKSFCKKDRKVDVTQKFANFICLACIEIQCKFEAENFPMVHTLH